MPEPRSGRRRGVVIAWMPVSQRSATIAERLGYDLVLVGRSGFRRAWTAPLAYPLSAVRTVASLVRLRPRAAIVAVPPFVAPLVAFPFLAVLRAPFAIDVHSGAVLDRRWRWSLGILARVGRGAVAAIVTLPTLEPPFLERGVQTIVIPDPLPHLIRPEASDRPYPSVVGEWPTVVAVCGWGLDEPIEALVAAARDRPWRLVLTGRPRRAIEPPENVELPGFLDQAAYVALLADAAAIVVLTDRDDTLLSGAWEAIAMGRPLVVSETRALRMTFGDDVRYVASTAESIAAGIDATLADVTAASRVTRLRERFARENDAALAELIARLERRDGTGGDRQDR